MNIYRMHRILRFIMNYRLTTNNTYKHIKIKYINSVNRIINKYDKLIVL